MAQRRTQTLNPRQIPAQVSHFAEFAARMRDAGQPELAIRNLEHYYNQVLSGATGFIDHHEARPVLGIPDYEELTDSYTVAGEDALRHTVLLKLNGGLGTTMGMNGPKSLLPVKGSLTFLDVIVRQILHLREATGVRLPLVLMNSFSTRDATLEALADYPDFTQDIPLDFLQHKKPKIWKDSLRPVTWPSDPSKEWCPPGHGDIYVSFITTGMLDLMLRAGYEYLFVSNSDNLGAVLDKKILGYFARERLPFLMEVANRMRADNKGGHLSTRPDGQLILRELSQCPPDEIDQFQDTNRYRFFNTNNLWLHLPSLRRVLAEHADILDLPLIRNEKPVDPSDPSSPRVYQLETAMGSAIALFPGAQALRVPRARFVPVKRNSELLAVWSDVYELTPDYRLRLSPKRSTFPPRRPPLVDLDDRYYMLIDDLQQRFPHGPPSMLQCTELRVQGDVYFGKDVVLEGAVTVVNDSTAPLLIPDGARIIGT